MRRYFARHQRMEVLPAHGTQRDPTAIADRRAPLQVREPKGLNSVSAIDRSQQRK